ncbi:MAG: C4-type zinc ribbon domain-containing protein [Verrucomicrobiota bacterium]
MFEALKQLLVLQDRDTQIRALQKEITQAPDEIARAEGRRTRSRNQVDSAKALRVENEKAMHQLQLEAETRRNTIGRLKTQQMETRKNEEYLAFEKEIANYQQQVTELEDQELALMEKAESLQVEFAQAEEAFAKISTGVESDLADIAKRTAAAQSRLGELQEERSRLAAGVEAGSLSLYERLLSGGKRDTAIAGLRHGVCEGCHTKVIAGTLHDVKAGKALVTCENCGRILYLAEE